MDGEPAEILQTNVLFRGVLVPAGRHEVVFEYKPWSRPAGLMISLVGLAALIGLSSLYFMRLNLRGFNRQQVCDRSL